MSESARKVLSATAVRLNEPLAPSERFLALPMVICATGSASVTISFLFENDGRIYGLTAGHLADVGDM